MSYIEASGPIKNVAINKAAASSSALVAAVTGKKIRVLAAVLSNSDAAQAVTVTFEDDDGVDRIGPLRLLAGDTITLPFSASGWGDTASGKALHILTSTNSQLGGSLVYQEIL
jgi:hypothetical protein